MMGGRRIGEPWKISCFTPLFGSAGGFVIGYLISGLSRISGERTGVFLEFVCRFYMLLFAMYGWALSRLIENTQLHCGGSLKIDAGTRRRYNLWAIPLLVLLVVATIFLVSGEKEAMVVTMLTILLIFMGEIGGGNPFKLLRLPRRRPPPSSPTVGPSELRSTPGKDGDGGVTGCPRGGEVPGEDRA